MAEKSGWNQILTLSLGKGIERRQLFAGQAGYIVFVSKTDGTLKIEKIVSCIVCVTIVNPDNIKVQMEGVAGMALMAALKDQIIFENGKAVQSFFHNHARMRFYEIPQ